jgi:hypothetical protein
MKNKIWAEFLRKEIEVLCERIEPSGTGHLYTAIRVLENRVKELEKE